MSSCLSPRSFAWVERFRARLARAVSTSPELSRGRISLIFKHSLPNNFPTGIVYVAAFAVSLSLSRGGTGDATDETTPPRAFIRIDQSEQRHAGASEAQIAPLPLPH